MSWIIASVIMFVSSVVLYLLVRKSALLGTNSQFNNLAMFSIPLVVYVVIGIFTGVNFSLTFQQYLLIFITALMFCYLGNVLSLKAIALAPNPGYSLVLSKSYVVFTTLVAVIIFQSSLSTSKAAAMLVIVAFSGLIMLGKKTKEGNIVWLPLSIGAFFCWGMLSLASKYLLGQQINIFAYLAFLYFFVTVFSAVDLVRTKTVMSPIFKKPGIFLAIGVMSSVFNVFMFYAVNVAPNLGYVNAINVSSISLVTLFSALLFGDELNFKKMLGVAGVIAGSIFLLV